MRRKLNLFFGIGEVTLAILIVAALFFMATGCDTLNKSPQQVLSTDAIYKRDMIITVNGVTEEGVLVVQNQPVNKFHVTSRGDLDMFSLNSCAGEETKEKAWNVTETVKSGLFGWGSKKIDKKREVTFDYSHPDYIQDPAGCPVQLAGFDMKGKHSWGFVDFKRPTDTLPGKIGCNGTSKDFEGVAACQARTGLLQVLEFSEQVMVSPDKGCEIGVPKGGKFQFPMPKGICVYRFETVKEPIKVGRVTLIGYDNILIREN